MNTLRFLAFQPWAQGLGWTLVHFLWQGATLGLRTILGARRVLLLAFGAAKADAVRAMVKGPRTSDCPASFLQGHPRAHIFLDEAAGTALRGGSPGLEMVRR